MNEILISIGKALLVTLVSSMAAVAVDLIRSHNNERREGDYYQPGYDEFDQY
jgi:hypothetical protein